MKHLFAATGYGFTHTFDFKGRTSRANFWLFCLGAFIISIIVNIILYLFQPSLGASSILVGGLNPIQVVVSILLLMPTLAAIARRLHDARYQRAHMLWYLIPNLLGYALFVVDYMLPNRPGLMALVLLSYLLVFIYLIGYVILLILLLRPSLFQTNPKLNDKFLS